MPVEPSILKSTKKNLGLGADHVEFDLDVITHINSAFFTLYQLGVGPSQGFMIEGDEEIWDDFELNSVSMSAVKTYIYLKTRFLFDPPGTPHHITAMKEQITELEYRLKIEREISKPNQPLETARPRVAVRGGDLDD